jgi:hypothetical protein
MYYFYINKYKLNPMSKEKEKKEKPVSPKKQIRLQMIGQLQASLPALKVLLGTKEFEVRIKKAAKLLTEGIKIKENKKPAKDKLPKKTKVAKKDDL